MGRVLTAVLLALLICGGVIAFFSLRSPSVPMDGAVSAAITRHFPEPPVTMILSSRKDVEQLIGWFRDSEMVPEGSKRARSLISLVYYTASFTLAGGEVVTVDFGNEVWSVKGWKGRFHRSPAGYLKEVFARQPPPSADAPGGGAASGPVSAAAGSE